MESMAASSSSHQQDQEFDAFFSKRRTVCESPRLFDVFINHRGPDVKQTLALQLYNSLQELGIRAFLDSQEKELGDSFPSIIETAISSASVHIAIFSKRYAESAWCLAELVLMLESQAKIIPMFYGVAPSDLRHIEKGAYADAFRKYEEKGRYLDKLSEWKKALQCLSLIAGEEFNSLNDWHFKNIVAVVQKEVQRKTQLHVAQYPVGLNNLVKVFERRCFEELVQDFENQCGLKKRKEKAKVIGIFGMGGAGKTTLAKELFNRKKSDYSRASFLFDVREASEGRELPSLQFQLLKDLFDSSDLSFRSIELGTSYLKHSLERSSAQSSFLIVVDDINHVEQLNALLIMDIVNKLCNTLVIVTTRDVGVLISAGITNGYRLKGMDKNHGRELFCWHAFDKPNPCGGYEELVNSFVDVCGGLPLSLQVLGRHVHGRSEDYWRSELVEVTKTLPRDVKQRLRISFDALNAEEKQIFMDIACFFGGRHQSIVHRVREGSGYQRVNLGVWEGSGYQSIAHRVWEGSGWNVQHALETLRDKCLVEETDMSSHGLRMHDHLRDLGREMALELSPPHRLWRPQDLKSLELRGFRSILTQTNLRCFHSVFDDSMNCHVTFFLGKSDNCVDTSASLLWLELNVNFTKQSMKTIPSWIPLQNLQCLRINGGRFKTLWENRIQAPSQLKELHISPTSLKNIPNCLGILDNLEVVFIDAQGLSIQGVSLLESLSMNLCSLYLGHSTVKGEHASTKRGERVTSECLVIKNFTLSGKVAWNNGGMSNSVKAPMSGLEKLEISNQELVSKILISGFHYASLQSIKFHDMGNLREVDLTEINTLNYLAITNCRKLKKLTSGSGIFNLPKLVELTICKCSELKELSLGHLSYLERVRIEDCKHLKSVSGFPNNRNLVELNLQVDGCPNLKSVSGNLESTRLYIQGCPMLEKLTSLSSSNWLEKFEIDNCDKLQNITLPTTLISLSVKSCRGLKSVAGNGDLTKLTELYVKICPKLEEVPSLSNLICLEKLGIYSCEKLQKIMLPTTLISLSIQGCRDLQRVAGISDLTELTELYIGDWPGLEEELNLSRLKCLKKLDIYSCEKLQKIMLPTTLSSLSIQSCRDLQRVAGISDLTELHIGDCPGLEEELSLSRLTCLKKIGIYSCEKLQKIMLPTTLSCLSIQSCRDLQRVAGISDLTELTELHIGDCPGLEEELSLSRLTCLGKIDIYSCEKLQKIMLPTTLTSLFIRTCRDLRRVAGTGGLTKLRELYIKECPELEELPSPSAMRGFEDIKIDSCVKVKNIAGIEDLHALRSVQLYYCTNTIFRNFISRLKTVQSNYTLVIGRAAEGAESTLNEHLFCDADIGSDAVTNIVTENLNERRGLGTLIICSMIVVDSSTSVEDINISLESGLFFCYTGLKVRQGEWIITMVAPPIGYYGYRYDYYYNYYRKIVDVLRRHRIMKKGFSVEVREEDDWKNRLVLQTIVDRLYHL